MNLSGMSHSRSIWSCYGYPEQTGMDDHCPLSAEGCHCPDPWQMFCQECLDKCEDSITAYMAAARNDTSTMVWNPSDIALLFLYIVVLLSGLIGNSLVIFVVIKFRRMQNVTNVFLASLSVTDVFLILICVPLQFAKFVSSWWYLGEGGCYAITYIEHFAKTCSILTLTVISVERYVAIVYPMKALKFNSIQLARKVVLGTWCCAAMLSAPTLLTTATVATGSSGVEILSSESNHTQKLCLRVAKPIPAVGIYQVVLLVIVPLITMTFCYGSIIKLLYFGQDTSFHKPQGSVERNAEISTASCDSFRHHGGISQPTVKQKGSTAGLGQEKQLLRKMSTSGDPSNTKKQIVRMLLTLVIVFVILWAPFLIDSLLTNYLILCPISKGAELKHMRMVFAAMTYTNSCTNPVIYAFMSKHFRHTFTLAAKQCCVSRSPTNNLNASTRVNNATCRRHASSPLTRNRGTSLAAKQTNNPLKRKFLSSTACDLKKLADSDDTPMQKLSIFSMKRKSKRSTKRAKKESTVSIANARVEIREIPPAPIEIDI